MYSTTGKAEEALRQHDAAFIAWTWHLRNRPSFLKIVEHLGTLPEDALREAARGQADRLLSIRLACAAEWSRMDRAFGIVAGLGGMEAEDELRRREDAARWEVLEAA